MLAAERRRAETGTAAGFYSLCERGLWQDRGTGFNFQATGIWTLGLPRAMIKGTAPPLFTIVCACQISLRCLQRIRRERDIIAAQLEMSFSGAVSPPWTGPKKHWQAAAWPIRRGHNATC